MIMTSKKGPSTVSRLATAAEPTYVICKSETYGDWQVVQRTPTGRNLMVTAPTFNEILKKYHEGEKLFASLPSF